jgi:hypothetical protein
MASTHEFLQAVLNMQQDAQANLPMEPNNGNPRGANNMPSNTALPAQAGGARHYPWLAPSSSMDFIRELLARPLQTGGGLPPTQVQPQASVVPAMSTNVPPQVVLPNPMQTGGVMPPTPARQGPPVVLPSGRVYDAKYGI